MHFNSVLIVIRDYFPLSFTKFYSVLSLGVMDLATNSWRWLFITGVQLWQHSCLSHLLNCVLSSSKLAFLFSLFILFLSSVQEPSARHTTVSSVCCFLAPSKEISTMDRAAEPTAQSGSVSMTCASLVVMCEGWILTLRKHSFTFWWHNVWQIFFLLWKAYNDYMMVPWES